MELNTTTLQSVTTKEFGEALAGCSPAEFQLVMLSFALRIKPEQLVEIAHAMSPEQGSLAKIKLFHLCDMIKVIETQERFKVFATPATPSPDEG